MELAATHRLERMRRFRILEEQDTWKREGGFDQIETIAQMDAQRFRAGFDSRPLYSNHTIRGSLELLRNTRLK